MATVKLTGGSRAGDIVFAPEGVEPGGTFRVAHRAKLRGNYEKRVKRGDIPPVQDERYQWDGKDLAQYLPSSGAISG